MPEQLRTARLVLRQWRDEDEAPLRALNSDPDVARWLNSPSTPEQVDGFFAFVTGHWAEHGYGPWVVEDHGGAFLGFVGIAHPVYLPTVAHRPELGWRIGPAGWGNGYATEAAVAARDHALAQGLTGLISVIHPMNPRSQRVATKLGMHRAFPVPNPHLGIETDIWELPDGPIVSVEKS